MITANKTFLKTIHRLSKRTESNQKNGCTGPDLDLMTLEYVEPKDENCWSSDVERDQDCVEDCDDVSFETMKKELFSVPDKDLLSPNKEYYGECAESLLNFSTLLDVDEISQGYRPSDHIEDIFSSLCAPLAGDAKSHITFSVKSCDLHPVKRELMSNTANRDTSTSSKSGYLSSSSSQENPILTKDSEQTFKINRRRTRSSTKALNLKMQPEMSKMKNSNPYDLRSPSKRIRDSCILSTASVILVDCINTLSANQPSERSLTKRMKQKESRGEPQFVTKEKMDKKTTTGHEKNQRFVQPADALCSPVRRMNLMSPNRRRKSEGAKRKRSVRVLEKQIHQSAVHDNETEEKQDRYKGRRTVIQDIFDTF